MHDHSTKAYREERDYGRLSEREAEIAEASTALGKASDREIMVWLRFTDPNKVRPRITEMIKRGIMRECGSQVDSMTGKRVRLVEMVPTDKQGDLF